jgi:hypothetical protein
VFKGGEKTTEKRGIIQITFLLLVGCLIGWHEYVVNEARDGCITRRKTVDKKIKKRAFFLANR